MRRVDIGVGAFFLVLGTLGITQSLQLDLIQRGGIPGPGMFPFALSVSLVLLGALVVITRLRRDDSDFPPFEAPAGSELRRVGLVMVALLVSAVLLPLVGYFLSSLALVAFLLFGVERLRTWRAALTTVALPGAFFLLFVVLLRVRLPAGFLGN